MDLLSQLAMKHGTDKGPQHHAYTPIYHSYFEPLRNEPVMLLEIGIGGYEAPDRGGQSMRMWAEYFKNGYVVTFDIHDKSGITDRPDNVTIFKGSQTDNVFLEEIVEDMGRPDIIIDDGSHVNSDVITTFRILFPMLDRGGIYVVEDAHTSYWPENYGGSLKESDATTMRYFKQLCDSLNNEQSGCPNYFHIKSIHFYKGLIFIFKKG